MSHRHLRHDKTCLNCGAIVQERYCTRCGQENIEPKESVGHLVGHFFADITHFDSKIFTTLKDLIFFPGFLSKEYAAGKRTGYLNPIRMYVFISALFFLALYAVKKESEPELPNTHAANLYRQHFADSLREAAKAGQRMTGTDSIRRVVNGEIAARLDTAEGLAPGAESLFLHFDGATITVDMTENKFKTLREYDSVQLRLPDSARHSGIGRLISRKIVRLKEKNGGHGRIHIEEDVRHTIPKLMFVLLPLFAWYVGWLHSRKKYYYVRHAIFSIHFHSFIFLLLLISLLIVKFFMNNATGGFGLGGISMILIFVYLVAALKNAYSQSIWLALVKAIVVSLIYLVTIMLALGFLEFVTFMRA